MRALWFVPMFVAAVGVTLIAMGIETAVRRKWIR